MMSIRIRPVTYVWSGNEMVPMPRFKRQCDEQFEVGAEYVLTILEARSRVSHNHFFAALHDAWLNLPEDIAFRFPSQEHLRAKALVETGWCTEKNYACASPEHALNLASYVRSVAALAVIRVHGDVVQIFEPMSQSAKAMGKTEFDQSKRDVLQWVSDLIGVSTTQLRKEGARTFPEPKVAR